MKSNSLYELTVDETHMNIIIRALSIFKHSTYDDIYDEVVDVPKAIEEIKIASDIQAVLKHQLGLTRHNPKQTSNTTGLMWCKEIDLDEQASSYDEDAFDQHNDIHDHTVSELLHKAWDNVKDKHWDTIKRMGDK